jgi:hypothetical protein
MPAPYLNSTRAYELSNLTIVSSVKIGDYLYAMRQAVEGGPIRQLVRIAPSTSIVTVILEAGDTTSGADIGDMDPSVAMNILVTDEIIFYMEKTGSVGSEHYRICAINLTDDTNPTIHALFEYDASEYYQHGGSEPVAIFYDNRDVIPGTDVPSAPHIGLVTYTGETATSMSKLMVTKWAFTYDAASFPPLVKPMNNVSGLIAEEGVPQIPVDNRIHQPATGEGADLVLPAPIIDIETNWITERPYAFLSPGVSAGGLVVSVSSGYGYLISSVAGSSFFLQTTQGPNTEGSITTYSGVVGDGFTGWGGGASISIGESPTYGGTAVYRNPVYNMMTNTSGEAGNGATPVIIGFTGSLRIIGLFDTVLFVSETNGGVSTVYAIDVGEYEFGGGTSVFVFDVSDSAIVPDVSAGPPASSGSSTPPTSDICFPAGTNIYTDQGVVQIQNIDPDTNTMQGRRIVDITKTITDSKQLVCIARGALSPNVPNCDTIISERHHILYMGSMVPAEMLLGRVPRIKSVPYSGEPLYNILLENHDTVMVHGMVCETVDPESMIAKLYTRQCKYPPNVRDAIIRALKECAATGNTESVKRIMSNC